MDWRATRMSAWPHEQSGASAAEFAMILPILVILLTGVIDLGGMAWTRMQVAAAARAGASYALTNAIGLDMSKVPGAVTSATNLVLKPPVVRGPIPGCPNATTGIAEMGNYTTPCLDGALPGKYVTVKAEADYHLLFGWPGLSNPVPLSSTAKVRIS